MTRAVVMMRFKMMVFVGGVSVRDDNMLLYKGNHMIAAASFLC